MKRFLAGALCVALLAPLFAQEKTSQNSEQKNEKVTLTVEQAVAYAQEHSRTLKSAQIDLEMKRRASKYGWNVLLPDLTVSGTMNRTTNMAANLQSANGMVQMSNLMLKLHPELEQMGMKPGTPIEDTESVHWAAVGEIGVTWNLSLAMIQGIRAAKANYEGGKISWNRVSAK